MIVVKPEGEKARRREGEKARTRESEKARTRESENARKRENNHFREKRGKFPTREGENTRTRESEKARKREKRRSRTRESEEKHFVIKIYKGENARTRGNFFSLSRPLFLEFSRCFIVLSCSRVLVPRFLAFSLSRLLVFSLSRLLAFSPSRLPVSYVRKRKTHLNSQTGQ